jgi:hypothetical protein
MTKVTELYGISTQQESDWPSIIKRQRCPFLNRKCLKTRKSRPDLTIGTCSVSYGIDSQPVIICPFRLLERSQIFVDCIHLLSLHEPGNELRIIGELAVPGGNIDYCLVSVRDGKPVDFVGIELQTLDTTGTVWPERQRFLAGRNIKVKAEDAASTRPFGMNWKMTAKTILVQLHHKVGTFEHLSKRLVLVMQNCLLVYMRRQFAFGHIKAVHDCDPMHLHAYQLQCGEGACRLQLSQRFSTDQNGIAQCLGLQATPHVELSALLQQIEVKLPESTLLTVGGPTPPVPTTKDVTEDDAE